MMQDDLTYGGGTSIQAVLDQLLDDGAQIYNDLTRLYSVNLGRSSIRKEVRPMGLLFVSRRSPLWA